MILGNLFALIDGIVFSMSGLEKSHDKQLKMQLVSSTCFLLSNIMLGAFTGIVLCTFGVVRNVLKFFGLANKYVIVAMVVIQTVLILAFNADGLLGILPLIASVGYTIAVMGTVSSRRVALAMFLNGSLWIGYDIYIGSYVGAIFMTWTALLSGYRLITEKKEQPKE